MSTFSNMVQRYKRATPKQLIVTGIFMLALAGSIGAGFAANQQTSAATTRDCDTNSIDYKPNNGGCGALSPAELIADLRQNDPSDLQAIMADERFANLPGGKYDRFASTAVMGNVYRNGQVKDNNGNLILQNASSMGRKSWGNPNRHPVTIGGGTYYTSTTQNSFAPGVDSIPVMIMFDADGNAESIVMTACGNPVWGDKVKSTAECKALNMTAVSGKENTYDFTTNAAVTGNAKVVKVEYFVDGSSYKSEANASTPVRIAFTKDSTVTVEVTVSVPGKQTRVIKSELCKKKVVVKVKKEVVHVCKNLVATSSDNKTFRFTVKTTQSTGVTVKSADFVLDNKTTTTGVTTKVNGDIYRDYTFTDNEKHTVAIKQIAFEVEGKTVDVKTKEGECKASVTREKAPECPEKPGSGFPPGDARCQTKPPEVPKEMPKSGPAGIAGLFAGVSAAGAIGHRMFQNRRNRRSQ